MNKKTRPPDLGGLFTFRFTREPEGRGISVEWYYMAVRRLVRAFSAMLLSIVWRLGELKCIWLKTHATATDHSKSEGWLDEVPYQ